MSESQRYFGYVRVHYPHPKAGRVTLRTEQDWERDIEPDEVDDGGARFDFLIEHDQPFLVCKPCLHEPSGRLRWAAGANKLVILSELPHDLYPHFFSEGRGRITDVRSFPSPTLGRDLQARLYLPAGYDENTLKCYPVLYMHDGRNLFFPQESFLGQDWQVDQNLELLDSMNLIDRTIVVGVYAGDREGDYTQPGYERYGRALVEDLKPAIDCCHRTLCDAEHTAVMGASLGGVVSFYLGWQWPQVFGNVACLSSTFGHQDDLLQRVLSEPREPRKDLHVYLDSGWPGDNYEVTLSLANALLRRGFRMGQDFLHLAFPHAVHGEGAWAARMHIPLQLFSGKARRVATRRTHRVATCREHASRVFSRAELLRRTPEG
ncbi:MAG: alpha/beta hydrolase [Planctomycetota bacterium]